MSAGYGSLELKQRQQRASHGNVPNYQGTRKDLPHDDYVKVENNIPNLSNEDIYIDLVQHNPLVLDSTVNPVEFNDSELPATYNETRTEPLLRKPIDYKMTVAKFEIPSNNIPFFYWKNGHYYVSMSETLHNFSVDTELQYSSLAFPSIFGDGAVGYVQQMLDSLNNAIVSTFNQMITKYEHDHGAGSWVTDGHPSTPPVMYYNSGRQQFYMYASLEWENPVNHYTYLYFNSGTTQLFQGFNTLLNSAPAPGVKTTVFDFTKTEPATGSNFTQYEEGKSITNWYDTFKIILVSNTIPARAEYIGGIQKKIIDGKLARNEITNNNSTNTLQILTEFTYEFNAPTNEPLIYLPTGEWRWIDLLSETPMVNIDVSAYTLSYEGELRKVSLGPGNSMYTKLLFRKK